MMQLRNVISIALVTLFCWVGCSASKKAFKEAQKFEEQGLYVEAAEADLKALDKNRKFGEAKVHLKQVAPKAYDELLAQAESQERVGNWEQAVDSHRKLVRFLHRCGDFGVTFPAVNVKERLDNATQKAARYYYDNAEKFFAAKSWGKAANAYLKAHNFVDNFNLSLEKAIQALVNAGNSHLKAKNYQAALKAFDKILEVAPGNKTGIEKMAETHYLLGEQFWKEGQFRKSFYAFQDARQFVPDFRDVERRAEQAYQEAVQFVAVFPFLNNTDFSVDGYLIASYLHEYLRTAELEFADFLSHPETVSLLSKSTSSRYGRVSESELLSLAAEEDLDSVVWGMVRKVEVHDSPERMEEVAYDKVVVVKDSSGRDVETTETIYFREYRQERKLEVELETMILDVQSGALLQNERYRERISDDAIWIGYSGSIYDLPKDKRRLIDAPRKPRPVPVLLNELFAAATDKIGRDLVRFYK